MEKICIRTNTRCTDNFNNNIDCPSNGPVGCEYCQLAKYEVRFQADDVGGSLCVAGIADSYIEAKELAMSALSNGIMPGSVPWAVEVFEDGTEVVGADGSLVVRELFGKVCSEKCENFYIGEHTGSPLCEISKNNQGELNSAPLGEVCPDCK